MAWRQAVSGFLRSGTMISMFSGVLVSGSYVSYKDYSRYRRMTRAYATGNILPPFTENTYEIAYFHRPALERDLEKVCRSEISNEYFILRGEVGVGKSRALIETVRKLMRKNGRKHKGAPIYVSVNQGISFPETLADAVDFYFDEHISFRFFLDYILRINSFPSRDNNSKLTRVLDAIEESSYMYLRETGQPVVLIVDGVSGLDRQIPGSLLALQEKAKLWADANTVKLVFVINDEITEGRFQENASSWSRAAAPYLISDLSKEEAIDFLTTPPYCESNNCYAQNCVMDRETAVKVTDLVGGRMLHLASFKRDHVLGLGWETTAESLKDREREKFVHVSSTPSVWQVVSTLRQAPSKCFKLSKLIKQTSGKDVHSLAAHHIVRFETEKVGTVVYFQSSLTESLVDEFEQRYREEEGGK